MCRGEKGDHDDAENGNDNVFDSYIHRVQISDASLDEVADSSGLGPGVSTWVTEGNAELEGDTADALAHATPTRRRKISKRRRKQAWNEDVMIVIRYTVPCPGRGVNYKSHESIYTLSSVIASSIDVSSRMLVLSRTTLMVTSHHCSVSHRTCMIKRHL